MRRSKLSEILILNGSPRGKSGNTGKLVDTFIEGYLDKKSAKVNHIELRNYKIKNCIGCFSCWKSNPGKCIHQDDMDQLMKLYLSADIVVWATPLYHHGMTSLLKTFVERTLPVSMPYIVKKDDKYSHPYR